MTELPDLTRAFTDAGLLDVAYTVTDSPLGLLLLAATDAGLLRVGFENEGHDLALEEIAARISPRVVRAARPLDPVRRELDEYFAGHRRTFDVALDRRLMRPGFFTRVLAATAEIPYGSTSSYAQVAGQAGSPRAYRAAGTALGHNPLPVVVPCHRVLAAGFRLGGYAGGLERKRTLLALEGAYSRS